MCVYLQRRCCSTLSQQIDLMKLIASSMPVLYSVSLSNAINSYSGLSLKSISHRWWSNLFIYFDIILIDLFRHNISIKILLNIHCYRSCVSAGALPPCLGQAWCYSKYWLWFYALMFSVFGHNSTDVVDSLRCKFGIMSVCPAECGQESIIMQWQKWVSMTKRDLYSFIFLAHDRTAQCQPVRMSVQCKTFSRLLIIKERVKSILAS